MSRPVYDAVNFDFTDVSYTAPAYNTVNFDFIEAGYIEGLVNNMLLFLAFNF